MHIHHKTIYSANILEVAVGTNCPQGGDTGHGGKTIFELINLGGTDIKVLEQDTPTRQTIRIELGGDSECKTFIEALEFAVEILKNQVRNNSKGA